MSLAFFLIGTALIELAKTSLLSWCGRASVLGSLIILAAYGYYVTDKCQQGLQPVVEERPKSPVIVEEGTKIARQDLIPDDYSMTLSNGSVLTVRSKNGTLPGVLQRGISERFSGNSSRSGITGGQADRSNELRSGAHDDGDGRTIWNGNEKADGAKAF